MKKTIILTIVCMFVVALLSASNPRAYTQKVIDPNSVLPNQQFPDVTCTSTQTAPGYSVVAYITTRPTEIISTATHAPLQIRLYRFGNGTTMPYDTRVFVQFGSFLTQWQGGDVVHISVTNNNVTPAMTDFWEITIPDNSGAALTVTTPVVLNLWPVAQNHIISGSITSQWDLTGVTISATDIDPANITYDAGAYTVTVPDGWDGVITPAKDGYIFEPASRTYTDVTADTPNQDFVMKTIVVPGVPTNLAPNDITLTYTEPTAVTLSWVAPADVNVDSYKLIWNNGEVQNIGNVLNWTTPALDAGTYTWKVCAVNNTPTKNYTPVRVQINGRSTAGTNNPKADGAWAEASFTVAIAPAEYNVNITSNPTGVAIYVDGTNSGEFTPHTFIMAAGTSAVYTVVLDHYTWVPADFAVTNIASDLSCEFLGTQVPYDIPADEPTVLPPDIPIPTEVTLQILIETVGTGGAYIDPIPLGDLPTWVNPAFTPTVYFTMDLIGLGPWTITFTTSTSCWVAYYLGGNWHTVQSMLSGTDFIVTFTIDTPPKDISDIPVVLGDSDPTLPVELSTFAATITAENYVNICWITQSETGMTGFNVYRNVNNNNLSSAHKINPNLIDATNTSSTQIYNLIDKEVENGNTYYYWLECVDRSHNSTFHETSPVYLDYITPPILPEYTTMRNAYPNPFRAGSGTTIEVDVKAGDNGTVTVYNILGQVVKTFPVAEGINNLTWNARDSKGNLCGNGIYFYKLSTKTINQTKKMVIIK